MILIGFATYPPQSSKQVVDRVMGLPRLSDTIKGKGNYVYTTGKGIVGLTIYEFDSSIAEEAIQQISEAYVRCWDVPGFNYELVVAAKAREAAKRFMETIYRRRA